MGSTFSSSGGMSHARVTDRKSMLKAHLLKRKNYLSMQPNILTIDQANITLSSVSKSKSNSMKDIPVTSEVSSSGASGSGSPAGGEGKDNLKGSARVESGGDSKGGEKSGQQQPSTTSSSNTSNLTFLDPRVLPILIEFLIGPSLLRCLEVCPLWYVLFLDTLDKMFAFIDDEFRKNISQKSLYLEYSRTDWSPVHTSHSGLRIDRVLLAKVGSEHINKSLKLSYEYSYDTKFLSATDNKSSQGGKGNSKHNPISSDSRDSEEHTYEASFQLDIFSANSSRNLYIHKDITRFHGDETRVASIQNVTPVRVGDRVEIAVNLLNAFGKVRFRNQQWAGSPGERYKEVIKNSSNTIGTSNSKTQTDSNTINGTLSGPVNTSDLNGVTVNKYNNDESSSSSSIHSIPPSIRWRYPIISPAIPRRICPLEKELIDWCDLDSFQTQSVERLQIPNFFSPQLKHISTEYAGLDIAVSRSELQAVALGPVQAADRILGSRFEVLPRGAPIILPLKRIGLQHDRFTKIQLREGDRLQLYISQGGRVT